MIDNNNLNFETVKKPWGGYERFTLNKPSTVKILIVNEGQRFSLQTHTDRDEYWKILPGGEAEVTVGENLLAATPGDDFYINKGEKHRIRAIKGTVYILEIAFGNFDEEDIERVEDDYGRA
jgi:mannose-1-phosphate guanylyltransferase/mannose-6-phosphate isomerase